MKKSSAKKMGGAVKAPPAGKKVGASKAQVKKGLVEEMKEAKAYKAGAKSPSHDSKEKASTKGLPKGKAPKASIVSMPKNLLKQQSHLHSAAGFVSKKK